jgi:hypothetical protein
MAAPSLRIHPSSFEALALPLPFVWRYVRNQREAAALIKVAQIARYLTMLFGFAEDSLQQNEVLQNTTLAAQHTKDVTLNALLPLLSKYDTNGFLCNICLSCFLPCR